MKTEQNIGSLIWYIDRWCPKIWSRFEPWIDREFNQFIEVKQIKWGVLGVRSARPFDAEGVEASRYWIVVFQLQWLGQRRAGGLGGHLRVVGQHEALRLIFLNKVVRIESHAMAGGLEPGR